MAEKYINEVVRMIDGHEHKVVQTYGTFLGEPMGSLFYTVDGKLRLSATISKQFGKMRLNKWLDDTIKNWDTFENLIRKDT